MPRDVLFDSGVRLDSQYETSDLYEVKKKLFNYTLSLTGAKYSNKRLLKKNTISNKSKTNYVDELYVSMNTAVDTLSKLALAKDWVINSEAERTQEFFDDLVGFPIETQIYYNKMKVPFVDLLGRISNLEVWLKDYLHYYKKLVILEQRNVARLGVPRKLPNSDNFTKTMFQYKSLRTMPKVLFEDDSSAFRRVVRKSDILPKFEYFDRFGKITRGLSDHVKTRKGEFVKKQKIKNTEHITNNKGLQSKSRRIPIFEHYFRFGGL